MQHEKLCACRDCRPLEFALKNGVASPDRGPSPNIRLSRFPDEAQMAFVVIQQLQGRD